MNWEQITGQEKLKNLLIESISENRVSHAQLFVGKEGYGVFPLALAYAQEILSRENSQSASKVQHFNHVDLHFSFPVFSEKNNSLSSRLFDEFREMMLENPYSDFEDFTKILESENKQFFISADEADDIGQKFSLKSFEGGTKILIVWRADKMNLSAANKFLKFLEEPPAKTVIILTAESVDFMLPTILSRTQIVEIPRIEDEEISFALKEKFGLDDEKITQIVHQSQGNFNEALKLARSENSDSEFEELFVNWVRYAFMAKKKPELLRNIIAWAKNIAAWNREKQKSFLDFCSEIFRLALMQNYGSPNLVYKKINIENFQWDKFSQYIHGANIESILDEISTADYHLERNGNSKIIWTDLGIKLTRFIHRSA
ncbi:MAG: DNA polymerase III subunit delta' [Flavobacteriaceae bacterium]|jgi:DNA polymerase-3 subunit delta'|nr:DNA polymerase III subunit delta' [Flavobacteriaceae bacterium]